jgi:hypothetical protein
MTSRNDEVYRALSGAMSRLGIPWYVFGAEAALVHGAAPSAERIEVTVLLGSLDPNAFASGMTPQGFSLRVEAANEFASRARVIPLVHVSSGTAVDVLLGGSAIEVRCAENARPVDFGGVPVPVAAVEDLIGMKVLAGTPEDLEDIVAILTAQPALELEPVRAAVRAIEQTLGKSGLSRVLERCVAAAQREQNPS